ncbi:hypothetical protein Tco_0412201 [Tanacetum coccineum]
MRCSNCQGIGHNKASCDKEPVPKVPIQRRPPGRTRQSVFGTHASARGHGRGSRGGRGARGGRNGSGRGARGGRNGTANRGQQLMDEDEIRENLEHDYMQDLLDAEEDKRIQQEREYQEKTEKKENGRKGMIITILTTRPMMKAWMLMLTTEKNTSVKFNAFTQESVTNDPSHPIQSTEVQVGDGQVTASDADVAASAQDKNKGKAIQEGSNSKSSAKPVRKSKRRQEEPQPFRIYVKNTRRSEAKLQGKNFKFDAQGTGSTLDKAFDVFEFE